MQVDWLKSIVLLSVGMTHAPLRFECLLLLFDPRRDKPNKVTRRHKGVSIGPLPSIFDTIHLIHLIFGTNHELSLYISINRNHVVLNWYPWQPPPHK